MTYPAVTAPAPASAAGDVVAMVLDQYAAVLGRYALVMAGDPAALRRAAGVLHTVASDVGESAGQVRYDVSTVAGWQGTARQQFDTDTQQQVHRLELTGAAAGRYAGAMDALADALTHATNRLALVISWFEQAARVEKWIARLPGVDQNWAVSMAYRTGERVLGYAESLRTELERKLAEFIAAVTGVSTALEQDFPAGTGYDGAALDGSRLPERFQPYLPYVQAAARRYNLDPALILGVIDRETRGRNIVGDGGHGRGLMQIDDRYHGTWLAGHDGGLDPESNIDYGAHMLRQNLDHFNGNTQAALAAYNSGVGRVDGLIAAGQDVDSRTTGHDYGADTIRRADRFRQLLAH